MSNDKHKTRGLLTRGFDIGQTDRVREALKAGPLSIDAIADFTGMLRGQVAPIMTQLCFVTGGVMVLPGKGKQKLYALWDSPEARAARNEKPEKRKSGVIGLPRTYTWRPLQRDPFEKMKLAMMARR